MKTVFNFQQLKSYEKKYNFNYKTMIDLMKKIQIIFFQTRVHGWWGKDVLIMISEIQEDFLDEVESMEYIQVCGQLEVGTQLLLDERISKCQSDCAENQ